MEQRNYDWWIKRFEQILRTVDIIRLDHFRGFAAYWEVPAGEPTAVNGQWVKGPGSPFFEVLRQRLGELPIIAEDLGHITPDVAQLRDTFEFPGMNILQFAFGSDAGNPYLPHNLRTNSVIYTGTHDNDTTVGWYETREEEELTALHAYMGPDERTYSLGAHPDGLPVRRGYGHYTLAGYSGAGRGSKDEYPRKVRWQLGMAI